VQTVPPKPEEVNYAAIDSPSLQFLPRQQEAQVWRLEEDPIVIPGDRLPGYLGADAARFGRYGALDLTIGKYVSPDGKGFATVEIFRFPDFVKAFGAYSMHKQGNYQVVALPNESFAKAHSIHLWRGPFYVRIVGAGGGDSLLRLAAFVADRMPPAPGKPAVFNFLPDKFRIPNSERFSAESGFGQPYLANSFQASFNVDGDVVEGLVIPASDRNTAQRLLSTYRQLYVTNGRLLDAIPNLGEDNFTGEDRYLGRVVAFRIDRFVIAFNGFKDRQHLIDLATAADQRMLGTIRKELVAADKAADQRANGGDANVPAWLQQRRQGH
jgi:hypothetical protein